MCVRATLIEPHVQGSVPANRQNARTPEENAIRRAGLSIFATSHRKRARRAVWQTGGSARQRDLANGATRNNAYADIRTNVRWKGLGIA